MAKVGERLAKSAKDEPVQDKSAKDELAQKKNMLESYGDELLIGFVWIKISADDYLGGRLYLNLERGMPKNETS